MSDAKEIKKLTNNILKARKIQKSRIEGEQESIYQTQENIEKLQAPVVKALAGVEKEAKDTVQALENQQLQLQQLNTNMRPIIQQQIEKEEQEYVDYEPEETWIQKFYQDFANNKTGITHTEMNLKGKIGDNGTININTLFNKGKLVVSIGKRHIEMPQEILTEGFLALILLNYQDLKKSEIIPTKADIQEYRNLMLFVGIDKVSKQGNKYKKYLKKLGISSQDQSPPHLQTPPPQSKPQGEPQKLPLSFQQRRSPPLSSPSPTKRKDISSEEDMDYESPKKVSETSFYPFSSFFGKGVFAYQDPKEIEEKLQVLLGSMKAGNNSRQVKADARALLDELLEINHMLPSIHKKFYSKFNL